MRFFLFIHAVLIFGFFSYASVNPVVVIPEPEPVAREPVAFSEIWGYLMAGEEKELIGNEAFTHICYFSASPDSRGRIRNEIARPDIILRGCNRPVIYLVIADLSNSALMHFSLNPAYGVRDRLIDDIIRVSAKFDGVQIDFESVLPEEAESFHAFLKELKSRMQGRLLSIAVPARTKDRSDAYSYAKIAPLVDRMVIMAYDQHWSGSVPGPVASLTWCADVVKYSAGVIGKEKTIMGLPLYGRAWPDKKLSRAMKYRNVDELARNKNVESKYTAELGPHFEYTENVSVSVFYDDIRSISEKLKLYRSEGIEAVSFWRIGQSSGELWNIMLSYREK